MAVLWSPQGNTSAFSGSLLRSLAEPQKHATGKLSGAETDSPQKGAASTFHRGHSGLWGRGPGSSAYTLRKENKYLCFKCVKHFSPGIKMGNSVSVLARERNALRGLPPGCSPRQDSHCSLSLFSHTSGCQKLKAFSVLSERQLF